MSTTSSRSRNILGKQNHTIIPGEEGNLESLNESLAENLSSKVGQLKSLAIDLETESHDHLPLLDGMEDGFDSTLGRLSNTYSRLRVLGRGSWSSGRRLVFAISGATFAILLILYLISSYR